jgi:hypothetical protein
MRWTEESSEKKTVEYNHLENRFKGLRRNARGRIVKAGPFFDQIVPGVLEMEYVHGTIPDSHDPDLKYTIP